jgi:uncharacterized RDD family membrane protein YckC
MQTESGSGAFSSPSAEASDTMEEESDTLQMLPNSYLPETDASEEKPKGLRPPKSQQIELAKPKLPLNKSTIAHEAVYAPPKPAAPEEEMEVDLAPFLGRTAAYLLDLIFLTVPIILMIYLGLSAGGRKDPLQWIILYPARGALRDVLFFAFFWFVSYFTLFTWLGGATPGKMIMGLHTIDWFGRPPSFARALARSLYYFLDAATFFIGFLWAFFSANGQAFHDKLAGTLVVKDE